MSTTRWRFFTLTWVALQRRATAVKVKRRHLVAEMCTLQTDKLTEPSCPIRTHQAIYAEKLKQKVRLEQ
jgi:hypothetical protein